MKSGIYKIINLADGKFYVGRAEDFKNRWKVHKSHLRLNNHTNSYLQNAWNKFGEECFTFEIVEYVEITCLRAREQWWLDNSKCCNKDIGYNLNPSAENSSGFKHTKETVEKIRANAIRLGLRPPSALGRKHSPETIKKQSMAKLGIPKTEQHKANMRKPKTKEHVENFIKARTGILHSEEAKRKISEAGRERDKWPHEKGNKCTCRDCKNKKNEYYRIKRAKAKELA